MLAASAAMSASPAHAHHAMGGAMPASFADGLLSGLGHPVIGPDHLAFVVAIGVLAALTPRGFTLIATFIAASLAGVAAHVAGVTLPLAELLVAASLIALGASLWSRRERSPLFWLNIAFAAGLVHGYAYGESIVGAETTPLAAYLIGLAAVQYVIAAAAMAFAARLSASPGFGEAWVPRLGAMLALLGGALLLLGLPFA